MNKIKSSCQIASFLMLLLILTHWQIASLIFANMIGSKLFVIILVVLFYLLNLVSAFGLFLIKPWGFWLAYLAILFSTIFFGTSYIPFIDKMFPINVRYIFLLISNIIVFAFILYLHLVSKKVYKNNV